MHPRRVHFVVPGMLRRVRRFVTASLVGLIMASICLIAEGTSTAIADDGPAVPPAAVAAVVTVVSSVSSAALDPTTTGGAAPAASGVLHLSASSAVSDSNRDRRTSRGDKVSTTWRVSNPGSDPITDVKISANRGSGHCSPNSIGPNGHTTCTTSTTLQQADLDRSTFTVTARASGVILGTTTSSNAATSASSLPGRSALSLRQHVVRVGDGDHNGRTSAGDRLQFVFTVTNTGTQTVHHILVQDSRLRSAHVTIRCSAKPLAPQHSTTCRSTAYTVTSAQAKQGGFTNTAQARATTPKAQHVFSAKSEVNTGVMRPPAPVHPRLSLRIYVARVAALGGPGRVVAGDTVTYGFQIRNVGSITVSGLKLSDPKLARLRIAVHCKASSLAPGASTTCLSGPMTLSGFTITQQELVNQASVRGTASNGLAVAAFATLRLKLGPVTLNSLVGTSATGSSGTSGSLPRTGGLQMTPVRLGLWLLLIGLGLVVAGRRTPRATCGPCR